MCDFSSTPVRSRQFVGKSPREARFALAPGALDFAAGAADEVVVTVAAGELVAASPPMRSLS
jgi:hypothetical protein